MFESIYKKDVWGIVKSVISDIFMAVVYTIILFILYCLVFGYKPYIVLSDSMTPTFARGDCVFVKKQNAYKVGDIITYTTDGGKTYVTHRVVAVNESNNSYQTKGDANNSPDGYKSTSQIAGKVGFWITDLGTVYDFFAENWQFILGLIAVGYGIYAVVANELEQMKYPYFYEREE